MGKGLHNIFSKIQVLKPYAGYFWCQSKWSRLPSLIVPSDRSKTGQSTKTAIDEAQKTHYGRETDSPTDKEPETSSRDSLISRGQQTVQQALTAEGPGETLLSETCVF